MANYISFAEDLILAGISVLNVKEDKRPYGPWSQLQTKFMTNDGVETFFKNSFGIAVICGKVSGNLECIDFDAHEKDINTIYNEFISDERISDILESNNIYIERTTRGGIHIIYKYENDKTCSGSEKLALWEDNTSMIETKGEGGYVIVAPTPGYSAMQGDLFNLNEIPAEQRDYLLDKARQFNRSKQETHETENADPSFHNTDPVSWYNFKRVSQAKALLFDKGWVRISIDKVAGVEYWRRPGKNEGTSATWGYKNESLFVFSSSAFPFQSNCYYSPFQILTLIKFDGDFRTAFEYTLSQQDRPTDLNYIRVGTDYYKVIQKTDRYDVVRTELKVWNKDEIKQDHGVKFLKTIPHYDDFTIQPNNFDYQPIIRNCYNLYSEFRYKPESGTWKWSEKLLKHIFGEQYELGLRYMQALYLHPHRSLPIIVLVSKERQTGKTTFINWLNQIFGANMVLINPEDLASSFNASYATANIIAVEETLIEKSITVEKIKALATGKLISVNQKFVSQYQIPFYGKIILASNNEDKFAKIDEEEIRFFVRKVSKPEEYNHAIEEELLKEIPAFLNYLTTLPAIDWSKDRSGFTPEELANESLSKVKKESKSALYKELVELFTELFANSDEKVVYATPTDIKMRWFQHNQKFEIQYIRKTLKDDFKKVPQKMMKYNPFGETVMVQKTGTPFEFNVKEFINLDELVKKQEEEVLPF